MPKKSVFFHSIHLFSSATKSEQDFKLLKEKFNSVFEKNCINKALILFEGENQITMDIVVNTDEYLFARLGKIKENSSIQFRNFKTLECSEVLSTEEADIKGLEIYTYCLIDYNYGVVSIVTGQAAPGEKALNFVLDRYSDAYYTQVADIASVDSVQALFSPGAVLQYISYTVAIPSSEVLGEQFIGLSKNQVRQLKEATTKQVSITLRNEDRRPLSNIHSIIKQIVESFGSRKDEYKDLYFHGRTLGGSSQDYCFDNRAYGEKIEVATHKTVDGQRVKLSQYELDTEYFMKIRAAYIKHKPQLLALCGRYE